MMRNLQNRIAVLLSAVCLLVSINAVAANPVQRMNTFLKDLGTFKADFEQTLLDAEDKLLEQSEGVMYISRPDRFHLIYSVPYDQLYVADGKRIWLYDRDLEQITVRKQENALGNTPALLLSGTEPLEKNFTIKDLGEHEGFGWVELRPRVADSSFEYMRMVMDGNKLFAMEMVDGFGQTTRLHFKNIKRNPKLKEALFHFTPPADVDVIGDIDSP